ncbi:Alpha-tocopherol transfer protein-like [Camponotus floridanus]|uniref:Alpha-tocopherol transfer protein-like n=1 Tax=Camponotus floridanus TaxID=104421 RepID=E2A8R2_CAMFO|nr:alpha-tocopherol transfer protein-like [Camponotus floridanus]EFN70141.1 Alpha-tocopherol transfer protein-like [Camponotus floridanus]
MSNVISPPRYVTIEEECKRNPKLKMSDLQIVKDWMNKQPHLPNIEMIYFVLFLHSNYYHLEMTKQTIDNFYTSRTHLPEIFSNRDPIGWKELRKAFTVLAVMPLEQKTKEGYIMTFAKLLNPDPNKFDYLECMKYFFMMCEVQNIIKGTSEGQIIIFDPSGLSIGHIIHINLMIVKKIVYYIQEAIPVRLKAIHILNTMPIIDTLLNMIKPFLKAELLQLIHFHSSLETMQEFVPIEALPNQYGGKARSIEEIAAKNIKLLEEFREWFQYDECVGRVNESLRTEKLQDAESLFGVDGSFKKLDID